MHVAPLQKGIFTVVMIVAKFHSLFFRMCEREKYTYWWSWINKIVTSTARVLYRFDQSISIPYFAHNGKRTHYFHFLLFVFSHACQIPTNRIETIMLMYWTHTSIHFYGATVHPSDVHVSFASSFSTSIYNSELCLYFHGIHLCQTFKPCDVLVFSSLPCFLLYFLNVFWFSTVLLLLLFDALFLFVYVECFTTKIALAVFVFRPAELLSCFCYWLATVTRTQSELVANIIYANIIFAHII